MNPTPRPQGQRYAYFEASWADDEVVVGIRVTPDQWLSIANGNRVSLRGKDYLYEGVRFISHWEFSDGLDGELTVSYYPKGQDSEIGIGFEGSPRDALITPLPHPNL